MADKKKMSVDEILAACREADGAGGAPKAPPAAPSEQAAEQATEQAAGSAPSAKPTSTPARATTQPGAMSTADILAAARGGKSAGEGAAPATSGPPAAGKPAAGKPAAAPAKPGAMNTADILAAARAGKSSSGATGPAAQKPAAEKPAAKTQPAAAKPAAAKPAAAKPAQGDKEGAAAGGPKDTTSILAAARAAAKPGPISKAAAAVRASDASAEKKKKEVPPMPEKPAYAVARPPAAPVEERRSFFRGVIAACSASALAVGFSSLAVTLNLWTLGLARFMFPNILTEPPTKFKVGFPDDLAGGQVQTKFVSQFGVWIVRYEYDGAPQIYALQTVCTHLGCTPNWLEGEQKFKCPCHGSGFYKDGINFEGPAPRPLERFAIRLADDGQLEVDKSRKFKEEMGQWRDPASFVPV